MKLATLLLLAIAASSPTAAQSNADSTAIIAVVNKLFDGMRTRDTASMRALFVSEARMVRVTAEGAVRADPVDGWLAGIGRAAAGSVLNEKTWAHEVRVEAGIAQAWMQYAFYIGDRLSHCGVDAFDFIKVSGAWKIVAVMDTRRTTGCTPP